MEESGTGDSIMDLITNTSYCPANVSLASIKRGEISSCFIDTVINPLLILVAAAAGLHQWRLYKRFSTPIETSNIRASRLFLFQILFQLLIPVVAVSTFVLSVYGYQEPITGVQVFTLVTSIICWTGSCTLTSLERHRQLPISARHGHGPVLLIFWTLAFMQINFRLIVVTKEPWYDNLTSSSTKAGLGLYVSQYLLTCAVFVLGLRAPGLTPTHQYSSFGGRRGNGEASGNGEATGGEDERSASEGSTWRHFWRKIWRLLPFMWPRNSPLLQLQLFICLLLLVAMRVTNVFVPIFYKKIVDALSEAGILTGNYSAVHWPWAQVLAWVGLKNLQGGGMNQGLLNQLRSFLWIRIQQHISRETLVGMFRHIHSLSLRWHLSRKTGEVLRVVDRANSAINQLMSLLVFNIFPTIVDILVAIIYFSVAFNIWFGVIILVTMVIYLACTIIITEWRTKFRRSMNTSDNEQRTKSVDSLLNAETVKYFSMESYEVNRYKEKILAYQVEEWNSSASLIMLNVFQSFVMNGGLLGISLYCAVKVVDRELTVGDFVLLGTYFTQLMGPLNWLGTLYRVIQESFVNMENMFDLMSEKVEVEDKLNAITLVKRESSSSPEIKFDNVSFHYLPEKPVLTQVSFTVMPGTTTAIVGASGSGKTTIGKLLARMYDVTEGGIEIGGVDMRDYSQTSVRQNIGVVPQDTVLFNDTIRYNIRYGRMEASDEEVEEAARMADIHTAIMGFPNKYDTVVGERGLKLSGGEKQRVAIARSLLRKPMMMIYDEATSSLDSDTERNIQEAITRASSRRTVIVIAHRLSTIVTSEQIIVLDQGRVVEAGTHQQLLDSEGKYCNLWKHQQNEQEKQNKNEEEELEKNES